MIHFLSEYYIGSYLEEKNNEYSTYCLGKTTHIGYYYWILKNLGCNNINLCLNLNEISAGDIVFFYHENHDGVSPYKFSELEFIQNIVKIQIVGDTKLVEWADGHLINDTTYVDEYKNIFFINFPLPSNIKKFKPNWPPINFGTCSVEWGLDINFKKKKYIQKFKELNMNMIYEFEKNYMFKPIDVFFYLRNKKLHLNLKHTGEQKHPVRGYKHGNRLYQSFYMNVPAILNPETPILSIKKSEYDFLECNNIDEFIDKSEFLKNNEDFFNKMVSNCISRSTEHSHENIKSQFNKILSKFSIYV